MICRTADRFASKARVPVSRFSYRVPAGTPLPLLADGMVSERTDHPMGDDLPIVAQVRF
jgi:hypothetical protein